MAGRRFSRGGALLSGGNRRYNNPLAFKTARIFKPKKGERNERK